MPRILVVEDDSAQRYLVDFMLGRVGYPSVGVGSGDEALVLLETDHAFDVILTDLRMPGIDSVDFLQAVHTHFPTIPIIVMTVHVGSEWMTEIYEYGASDVLPKPFYAPDLIEKIASVLRKQTQTP